jgi:TolA-binding protein
MNDFISDDSLPLDIQALLDVEKGRLTSPVDGRARLTARLASAVPMFGPATTLATTGHATELAKTGALKAGASATKIASVAAPAAAGGSALKIIAAGIALVALASSGVVFTYAKHTQNIVHPRVAEGEERPITLPPPIATTAKNTTNGDIELYQEPAHLPAVPGAAPPPPAAASNKNESHDASLREEERLLDVARNAIVAGDFQAAVDATLQHAKTFPHGSLAEERDALRIRALAKLGRKEEARSALDRLRSQHPHSFLIEGATIDVESIP